MCNQSLVLFLTIKYWLCIYYFNPCGLYTDGANMAQQRNDYKYDRFLWNLKHCVHGRCYFGALDDFIANFLPIVFIWKQNILYH